MPQARLAITPDQAQQKICPFRGQGIHGDVNCRAADCMAWRWSPSLSVDNPSRAPGAAKQTITIDVGFCGLAGKP